MGWLRWFWRTLTSMRTALILLFLFALASVPGSIYPQRGVDPGAVAQYFKDNPGYAEWLDRFWLFDVFQAPWFAAIYLLLFVSLIGCVVPRLGVYARELRRRPPAAPRNLARLPQHAAFTAEGGATVEDLAAALRRRRFRVATGPGWVSAEKGYLRESGNLIFHIALLGMLVAVGLGSLYGYRGNVLIVEGNGFANTVAAYDRYMPGTRVSAESLAPFSFQVEDFQANYVLAGQQRGQVLDFLARLKVTDRPGAKPYEYTLKVNEPLEVDGTQTYLIGHGYAPSFTVLDGQGQVAYQGPVPCLAENINTFASECTIKVPDAKPEQLGLSVRFLPTTVPLQDGTLVSAFPAALQPTAQVRAFAGDLGLSSGIPQSVYLFDTEKLKKMKPLVMKADPLEVGQSIDLPGGAGKVTFTGVKEWISLQIAYDPGRVPALIAAVLAIAGLLLSLTIRRRRIWVRVQEPDKDGSTVVQVGGLTRTEGGAAGFAEEFADIVKALGATSAGVKDAR
ncbi:cytochrome c biogenesis protein ResB [Microtetraspora sp. NBRC 13810]|uniref:cytochrome c biogenesis protein ResB n=1 Tax=Microtetraspora sp. NBRC 13810 TaxID=3030990 RepID=UPI002556776F|nr:cytochrome c biogenesis protein ResB [Microtetraspora sp. NBRC 13810]